MLSKVDFRIKTIYNILRPSEKKVADYNLEYQGSIEDLSMTAIAREVSVSQPTIMRFVKGIGYNSFKQFKYELIKCFKDENNTNVLYGFSIEPTDKISDLPAKIVATATKMLENSLKSLSLANYEQTVELINQSRHISIYAVENSIGVAQDLMTKLLYLGKSVTLHNDYYLQSIDASNLTKDDLAIGISYSGNSKNTVEVIKTAHATGAKTIAIVNFENTMLTKYANIVLSTSNDQFLYGDAIFSRTVQVALVDMIYMGVIISEYDNYTKRLDQYSKLIKPRGYQKEEL